MTQREIKFRAWDKKNKIMIFHYDFTDELILRFHNETNIENIKFMQFTGLKDKNGVEIYEGDIVKQTLGKHIWIYLITTKDGFANTLYAITRYRNFHTNDEDETEWGDFYVNEGRGTLMNHDKYEVIGNIYENKDLLK